MSRDSYKLKSEVRNYVLRKIDCSTCLKSEVRNWGLQVILVYYIYCAQEAVCTGKMVAKETDLCNRQCSGSAVASPS